MEVRSGIIMFSLVSLCAALGSSRLDVECIQSCSTCSDIGRKSRSETLERVVMESKRARGKCLCLSLHLLQYCVCLSVFVYVQLQLLHVQMCMDRQQTSHGCAEIHRAIYLTPSRWPGYSHELDS